MDIWINAPSGFKGLNGMNRPDPVCAALYETECILLKLAQTLLNREGESGFGNITFKDVSFAEAKPLAVALYEYGEKFNWLRHVTFYFSNPADDEAVDNAEREAFSRVMLNTYPTVLTNKFRCLTSADIVRRSQRRHAAIDELTELAENSLLMPSHPERDI